MKDERVAEIRAGLEKLDHANSDHWTEDGMPRLDALKSLGLKASRKEISAAAPTFVREEKDAQASETGTETETKASEEAEVGGTDTEDTAEVGVTVTGTEDVVAEIDGRLDRVREACAAIDRDITRLGQDKLKLQEVEKQLLQEREVRVPRLNAAQAVKAYQDSQLAIRMRRHAGYADLSKLAGGKLPPGLGKAPIDAVRTKTLGHGHQVKVQPVLSKPQS